jgi:6-phosphogluconolactonase
VRERLLVGEAAKAHFLPLWPEPDPAALRAIAPFDAVMLGMGEDGHIASLIPGDPGLAAAMDPGAERLTVSVPEGLGKPPLARISLTLAALLQARAIFLLIAGKAKREVIQHAQAGADLPVAALIAQTRVPVRVLWSPAHEG